ncbi:MAG: outer membrane beta-barrel family protein [Bacteroidales bacterium]|nr:outer membrane beta-barrel family protein [Bacteroidales bacterium]
MIKKLPILLILLASVSSALKAEDYMIEIKPDKKILYLQRMGLSPNTSVKDVLNMMPELIERGGDDKYYFENYDIQVDGKSVGNGRDVVLEQVKVAEIEKVEISNSPSVSQQKNGQGGVINLVQVKLSEGLSGDVYMTASTEPSIMPSVNLNYKTKKLELWSSFHFEYYSPRITSDFQEFSPGKEITGIDTNKKKEILETAKINIKYHISPKDMLKAWIIENYNFGSTDINAYRHISWDKSAEKGPGWMYNETSETKSGGRGSEMSLLTMAEYEHLFRKDFKFVVSAGYERTATRSMKQADKPEAISTPQSLNTEIKLEYPIISDEGKSLIFKIGLNSNYSHSVNRFSRGGTLYESPFAEFRWAGKKLFVNAGARYQYNARKYSADNLKEATSINHDFTANVNALWQIVDHHALRFMVSRNLLKPNESKLYGEYVLNPDTGAWILGNPNLFNAELHTFKTSYIHDWTDGTHSIVFNAEVGYNRADGVIEEYSEYDKELDRFYTTYRNTGINNIIEADVSLFYRVGIFSMAFSGNVFHNSITKGGSPDRYTYFNLCFTPVFRFNYQWTLSARGIYNSPVLKKNETLGDCLYAQLRLNKSIRNWTLFFELNDIFDFQSNDFTFEETRTVSTRYDMYARSVLLGFSYKF